MSKKRFLVAAFTLLALGAGSSAWAQQYARPDQTLSNAGWSPVNAASPHEAVDETAPNGDTDYIDTSTDGAAVEFGLTTITDPGVDTGHIVRYSCKSIGGGGPERCNAALYQGAAEIANNGNNSAGDTWATITFAVPEASAANITNYADLRVVITATSVGNNESVQISWVELEVPGAASSAPSVTTIPATGVTNSQATLGGNVSSDGNLPLNGVGVYYSTTSGFTPPGQGTQLPMTIQPVPGNFTGDLTSLPAGTTYYFRAYAANSLGETIAANEEQFTTKDFPVMLATPTLTIESPTSATLGGTMTSDGFDTAGMVDCGVEWSESPGEPYEFSQSVGICTENDPFTTLVINLTTGTDYYFRSYATNSVGTAYSNERQFRPVDTPTVTATIDTPSITDSTAVLGGDITDTGGDTVTAVGIIWDTDSDPINNDNGADVPMTVADPFSQEVTGLPAGTPLWFVAYAENGAGRGYSSPATAFTTDPGAPTMDPTPSVTNVDVDSATLGGTMTSDGGGTISDCGVEWGTTPGGPYGPPQSAGVCTENVAFSTPVSGLTTSQTYYFRAYATNGQGTDYSNEGSFIPQGLPVVVSSPEANPSYNSAELGGNVTNDGGSTVSQRGIVWDLNPDPELQPTKTIVPIGEGTGPFSATVSLPPASTIYFEAYATNAAGTAYSDDNRSFPTGTEPTLQATNAAFANVAGTSVRITWTRGNGEGVIVVMRETATPLVDPQDTVDYAYSIDYTAAPEIPGNSQNFVVYKGAATSAWVTGLTMSTAYSVAVYEYAGSGASTDYLQTLPAEANDVTKNYASHNYDYRVDCTQCHGGHFSIIPRGEDQKAKCVTCHQPGQAAAAKLEFNNHLAPNRNPGIDQVDCGMCHELHNISGTLTGNTTLSDNTITPGQAYNKSFLRANVGKYVDPNYSADKEAWPKAFLHNDTPKRTDGQGQVTQEAVTPERAVEGGTDITSRGYCQVCHTQTAYHRNNPAAGASTPSDHSKAGFMQCHDGSTSNNACAEEVHCGDCHEHNNSFVGVNANLPCEQCHDQVQGSRPIITTQFDTANVLSSHIPNGIPVQADCMVCHGQHTHDGFVYGFDADDGATKWGTDNADTLATGAGEVFEPHCMSCHEDASADYQASQGDPDRTANSPFIGANRFPIIDQASWDASGHDRPSGTFPASPVTCVGDGANGCHGSGHGSQQASLLAPADAAVHATTFCTNCHDGTPASNILADFTPAVDSQMSDGTYYQTYNKKHDVLPADQTFSSTAMSCKNCHDPHANNTAAPVNIPGTGTALTNYAPTKSYTGENPFAYDGSGSDLDPENPLGYTGPTRFVPDYVEFCLTCHDGTAPDGLAMPSSMTNIAVAYQTQDQHGNQCGNSSLSRGWLKEPWATAAMDDPANPVQPDCYAAMNCTMCHGAHGEGNVFNLKLSVTVADQQMSVGATNAWEGASGTSYEFPVQEEFAFGAWCTFCHEVSHDTRDGTGCQTGHRHGGGNL